MIYTLGIYLYAFAAIIASFFSKKIRKRVYGIGQTFRLLHRHIKPTDRVAWFHAASLGEFEQGRPLMERLRIECPEYKILLTFFSPSGYEVRKDYEGADLVCYIPFDTLGNVSSFIRLAHPEIAIFIKYEFWTNFLKALRKRGTKVYSISSIFQADQHFFKWYGSLTPIRQFDHLFVQNQLSKDLLAAYGITNTTVVGDTRLDRVIAIRNAAAPLPLVEQFAEKSPCFIAGSSWGPDEEIYIPYFAQHKDWRLIIAPHVISETHLREIEKLLAENGFKSVRYTELENTPDILASLKDDISGKGLALIVNCFGKLSSIYRYGKVALVGGGFGVGIHNVPEAAVYGIPVLFGPNNQKFREAQALKACGGSFEYQDEQTFANIMDRFIQSPQALQRAGEAAGNYINSNAGATEKCFKDIFGEVK
ncbi:MAG: glycosyltransferase N-terminal domain-containing protein [Bacteroidaceae bacterium]|nr:glycosyltransferase N-terminal domain-containing protein [Bacteroidaceae bacterium]